MFVNPTTVKPDRTYQMATVQINEYLLKNHNINKIALPAKRSKNFKGVVIHNTERVGSLDDGRQYTAATLNDAVATRTHYYITELGAWKNLDDVEMNWSCGDGTTGEGNNGCISLEIIMDNRSGENNLKARDNGAKIAAYILAKNNMTVDSLYTHNYFLNIRNGVRGDYNKLCTTATPTRNCPYYIVWDWENFRKQVDGYVKQFGGKSIYTTAKPTTVINTVKEGIYLATSSAAMRTGPSKNSKIINRVTKGKYYVADKISDTWIQHCDSKLFSMLNDGGALFTKVGVYEQKQAIEDVYVRVAPTQKSQNVATIKKGQRVYLLKGANISNEGYNWRKIVVGNDLLYVAGDYLK